MRHKVLNRPLCGASRLVEWLSPWNHKIGIGDLGLELQCEVVTPSEEWISPATVSDGIDGFCEFELRRILEKARPTLSVPTGPSVKDVRLVKPKNSRVRNQNVQFTETEVVAQGEIALPDAREICIPCPGTLLRVRSFALLKHAGAVRPVSDTFTIARAGVRDASARVRMLPHVRRSVNLESVSPSVNADFLREAATTYRVESGQGEILAIFRSVPVAMISRVCFLEDRRVLLYTIPLSEGTSRTRVHDLAAVRDRVAQKTHLVAHRTRCATAILR